MLGLRGSLAGQVVLIGLAAILQSCGTSCPHVGATAGGRVSPHLSGGGQLRLQGLITDGPYCQPALRGGGEGKIHRSRSGIEEDEAVSRPKRTPSVLREGSSQCMPNGNPPRVNKQMGGVIDTPSNPPPTDANGTMLNAQPPLPPPGGARLDGQPATAPQSGRDSSGATIVKTLAQLTWFYDIELNENGVRATTSFCAHRPGLFPPES